MSRVLKIRMDGGTELECRAGDVSLLPSGHDAWVAGDEPAVVVEFQGMIDYAKSRYAIHQLREQVASVSARIWLNTRKIRQLLF